MSKNNLISVRRQLFQTDFDSNKHDMTGIVPLKEMKYDKKLSYSHSNELLLPNDTVGIESDDYDSDCSLGSMNSFYISLKDKIFENPIENGNSVTNKLTKCFKNNITTKINNGKSIKINTKKFYNKEKSNVQYASLKLLNLLKQKQKYKKSKLLKSENSISQNTKHLRNQKMSTIQKNEKLFRNQLKIPIPLLSFTPLPNTIGIFKQNKINIIMDPEPINIENLLETNSKNQCMSNPFFVYDFIDTDYTVDTKVIDDIIESLNVEDN